MKTLIRACTLIAICLIPLLAQARYPDYHSETVEDLRVKVLGGQVAVQRTWYKGQWSFNRNWEPLSLNIDPLTGKPRDIKRGGASYKKADALGQIFKNSKRKTIRVLANGYLWSNLEGQWIQYDSNGRIVAYGNKNNVKVSFVFDEQEKLIGILDHFDTQVITYTYNSQNQLEKVEDYTGRDVNYEYDGVGQLSAVVDVRGQRWEYGYSSTGDIAHLASIKDPLNRTKSYTYNAAGVLKSIRYNDNTGMDYYYRYGDTAATKKHSIVTIRSTSGVEEIRQYNDIGRLVRKEIGGIEIFNQLDSNNEVLKTDKNGNQSTQDYDGYFNLKKITHEDGTSRSYSYKTISATLGLSGVTAKSNLSLKIQETNERGVVTKFEYDARGNLTRQTQAYGTEDASVTEYDYDTQGNLIELKRLADAVTQEALWAYEYDNYGNVIKTTDPEQAETEFTYNALGQVLVLTDALDKPWVYTYDARGNRLSLTDPLLHKEQYTYDAFGNLQTYTNKGNKTWTYNYDDRNNLVKITNPLTHEKKFKYNHDNLLIETADELNHRIYYQYDALNRLVATSDESGYTVSQNYPDLSLSGGNYNQASRIDYPSFSQTLNYDVRKRLRGLSEQAESLEVREYQYQLDAVGNLTELTDPIEAVSQLQYDLRNNLNHSASAGQSEVGFTYDARNNLINLNDPNQHDYGFTYDRLGRVLTESRPMGETTNKIYDALGNLTSVQDAKNQLIKYSYDDALRLVKEEHFAAVNDAQAVKTIDYSYNARGLMTGWNDGEFSAVMTYDDLGRKLSENVDYGDFNLGFAYSYYANGLRNTYTAQDGTVTSYTYDNANRLVSLSTPTMGTITVSQYHNNQPAEILFPGGLKRTLSYNNFMQLTDITLQDPAGQVISDQHYNYRADGQITDATMDGVTKSYSYDADKRLTEVSIADAVAESFEYDAAGNRTRLNGGATQWQYNANNELLTSNFATYQYDDNGNMIQKTESGEVVNYLYDELNRLVEVRDGNNSLVASYKYDPFNRRLLKNVGGEVTHFSYSDDGLIGEATQIGSIIKSYEYWLGSTWSTNPVYQKDSGVYYFYENDVLATPDKMFVSSGEVKWDVERSVFGNRLDLSNEEVGNNLEFPGQYLDDESKLYYNWNRFYFPSLGQYISIDPIGLFGGINLYKYVNNSPVVRVDSEGKRSRPGGANAASNFSSGLAEGLANDYDPLQDREFEDPATKGGKVAGSLLRNGAAAIYDWMFPGPQKVFFPSEILDSCDPGMLKAWADYVEEIIVGARSNVDLYAHGHFDAESLLGAIEDQIDRCNCPSKPSS